MRSMQGLDIDPVTDTSRINAELSYVHIDFQGQIMEPIAYDI